MNLQDFLRPIEAFFMFTFDILKAGGQTVNNVLTLIIAAALVYWTIKLIGYQKDEVPNR